MPSDNSRAVYYRGEFKYSDALNAKEVEALGKMVSTVIKSTADKAIVPNLFASAKLKKADGIHAKLYDWSIGVALQKPEGGPSGVQKITPTTYDIILSQWEYKVGITDEASITGNITATDVLSAPRAGRAFARAIDADGFDAVINGGTPATGTHDWSSASDDDVIDDITSAVQALEDAGYEAKTMLATPTQRGRLMKITNGLTNPRPLKQYMIDQFGLEIVKYNKITYKKDDGTIVDLFNPNKNLVIGDFAGSTVFAQLPMRTEAYRDVESGVNYALMRKFFKSSVLFKDGVAVLNVNL